MIPEQFEHIARVLPEPMLLIGGGGHLLGCNPPMASLLGRPREALLEHTLFDLVRDDPDDVKKYLGTCARSRAMVLGSLVFVGGEEASMPLQCQGAVLRPWTPEDDALIVLRCRPQTAASNRFVLLNQKIQELAREIHVRKAAEREREGLLQQEQSARARAEASEARMAFLAEASVLLVSSLNYETTIQRVTDLMVPPFAAWCSVDLIGPDQKIHQVAVAHTDPTKITLARELRRLYPLPADAPHGIPRVIRTGETEFYPDIPPERIHEIARDSGHLALLEDGSAKSSILVPLRVRGRTLGTLTLLRSNGLPRYTEADLRFAEEIAFRAAVAVDNARLYREAQEAERQAEKLSHLQNAFLTSMSHEIRTPLTSIIGFASVLAEEATDVHQELARLIELGGKRLLDTLNAVLALAKLEANELDLKLGVLDIVEEIKDVMHLMQSLADPKGLPLVLHNADAPVYVQLDRGALSSILHNLIGNAIKFTEHGSVDITVQVDPSRDEVSVHVADSGIGIDASFLPELFEPFRQESIGLNRVYEGTGLGLAITKRLVTLMQGTIDVSTDRGVGSIFTVTFHTTLPDRQPLQPSLQTMTQAQQETSDAARPHLLVVEDNPDTQLLMQYVLEEQFEVTVASNAEEAVSAAQTSQFDIILMDINLGKGPSGDEVLSMLRTMPAYRAVPIAAVTAYALPNDRERFLQHGFDAYLSKPFDPDELLRLAATLLIE